MNRRSFFRNLAVAVGAAAAPGLFLPKLERVQWKRTLAFNPRDYQGKWKFTLEDQDWVPNPAYHRAKYEVFFYDATPLYDPAIFSEGNKIQASPDIHIRRRDTLAPHHNNWTPHPVRGDKLDAEGILIPIAPFVLVRRQA